MQIFNTITPSLPIHLIILHGFYKSLYGVSQAKNTFSGGADSWLREEQFLKIHLELTLLTEQTGLPREDSEEIAGECLLALWMEYEQNGFPYPIKPFLLNRMESLIQQHRQNKQLQKEIETFYWSRYSTEILSGENYRERLVLLHDELLPFLEIEERAVLQPLLLYGMDLPAIAAALHYPLSKVRKHYKHGIFRLQKHLGLWRKI